MGKKNDETLELVREAIDKLKRGDTVDALTTLERCAFPKFHSPSAARRAYFASLPANDNAVAPATANQEAAGDPAVA